MTYLLLQPLFIDCAHLLQQDHRILHEGVAAGRQLTCVGSFALFILEVIAAQITVGLCRFRYRFV